MAAFILATLISALFALPAQAASGDLGVSITSPTTAGNVKAATDVVYTITVTNTDTIASLVASLTDDIGTGVYVGDNSGGSCTFAAPTVTCPVPAIAASGTWTVQVTVTAPAAPATLTNTATVIPNIGAPADSVPGNNQAVNTQTVVATLADVTIAKNHTAGTLTPGSDVTYNLVVSNAGPDAATTVSVSDTLNASLTFKSSASGCTNVGQVVTCAIASVPVGSTTVSFVATISPTAPTTTAIPNSATVTTATPESNGTNNASNTDSFTPTAASVDLGVTVAVDPATAAPGDTVTYTVTVTNPDVTTDATNVVVTDVLPAGLTAVTPPTTPSSGTAAVASNTWTWTIPTVVKATSATAPTVVTATFDATVDETTTLETITNTVTMMATQTDPVSTNNTASVDLTIAAEVADLNIVTAVDDAKPNQGDTISIYIQVSNAGPADATNIVLKDVLPTGLKYESCEPTPCEQTGLRRQSSQLFSMPLVAANSAGTIVLNVVVQASEGTLQNTASVVSFDQSDPTGANNSDSLNITVGGTASNPGSGSGGTGGTGGTSGGTGGTTAYTGFTASQLIPWFMLLFSLGLVAIEWARRMRLVSPIGSTYGFEPFQS